MLQTFNKIMMDPSQISRPTKSKTRRRDKNANFQSHLENPFNQHQNSPFETLSENFDGECDQTCPA